MRKVLVIMGPTASGKTKYSIDKSLNIIDAEIINFDSIQVYKDLKILTSFPSESELKSVNHKLFGYLDYNQKVSVMDWAKLASIEINNTLNINKTPILVGGTGLYINTLINGISPIPEVSYENRKIALDLAKNDYQGLCKKVYNIDNSLKDSIYPSNHRQMIRAYEVYLQTNRSINYFYNLPKIKFINNIDFEFYIINIDRAELYNRINLRFDLMIESGAIDEVRDLLYKINIDNLDEIFNKYPIFKAIGSKEIALYLKGFYSFEKMLEISKINSRRYAKRQITWFKNQYLNFKNNYIFKD